MEKEKKGKGLMVDISQFTLQHKKQTYKEFCELQKAARKNCNQLVRKLAINRSIAIHRMWIYVYKRYNAKYPEYRVQLPDGLKPWKSQPKVKPIDQIAEAGRFLELVDVIKSFERNN